MKIVRETTYDKAKVESCNQCHGTGTYVIPGYDHGHGWSRDELRIECPTCQGSGRVVVVSKGVKRVKSYTADEWPIVLRDPVRLCLPEENDD